MRPRAISLLAVLALTAPAAARAQAVQPYGLTEVADGHGYGYAGPLVRGAYVGAPLTRFPRPTEIVPAPWSYGTYGVPTVTGIPAAPTAQPTLTVIGTDGSGRPDRTASRRGRSAGGDDFPADPRIIQVRVPRR